MKSILIIATILFSTSLATAQQSKNYWVIETNVHQRNYTILRVYDSQNALVHEETIKGKAWSVLSRRDRKRIEKKVKEIMKQQAWARNKKQG